MDLWKRLVKEESGVDATEYALLAALVAVAIIGGATILGGGINNIFTKVGTLVNNKAGNVPAS